MTPATVAASAPPPGDRSAGGRSGPRGRDAVVAALVDAAGRELAAKGPAAASVRAIAAAAGVNHGLVHRHFGSKQAMVAAVLDDLAVRIAERSAADPSWPLTAAAGDDEMLERFWRVLARTILDGDDPAALRRHHPYVQRLVELLREHGLDDARARLVAAQGVALGLGWVLFEPFLEAAAGLDPAERSERRRSVVAAAQDLVARQLGR